MTTAATHSVVIEKEFPHPPERIWRALTQGSLIKEWLMDNDFQPVVGHKFSFRATPVANWSGVIDSQVLVVEPNRKLSYTWGTLGVVLHRPGGGGSPFSGGAVLAVTTGMDRDEREDH